jgi:hypothetical protein
MAIIMGLMSTRSLRKSFGGQQCTRHASVCRSLTNAISELLFRSEIWPSFPISYWTGELVEIELPTIRQGRDEIGAFWLRSQLSEHRQETPAASTT